MTTGIYAVMHFFVDYICAWSMYFRMGTGSFAYGDFLIYNFCAFALQMPLGTLLDLARSRAEVRIRIFLPLLWSGAGVLLTGLGAMTHPALLGIGNALFHVGGGLDVIVEDFQKGRNGKNLGIFVAPGAVGLYLGSLTGNKEFGLSSLILPLVLLVLCISLLGKGTRLDSDLQNFEKKETAVPYTLLLCCFAVVVIRSWTGFEASFPWKQGAVLPLIAVLAVASGKALGGFAAARFGAGRTMSATLIAAAGCFLMGENPLFGLAALLLFNMSMPVTLYLLARSMPRTPGFAFGLLTFGLFLGFLPVYWRISLPLSGGVIGALGSVISGVLMGFAWKAVKRHAVSC